jgi:peptide/nickel transport system substrate-binding protein
LYQPFGFPVIPVADKVTINHRLTSTALTQDLQATPKLADLVYRTLTPEDLATLQTQKATLGITVNIASSPFIRYLVFNLKAGSSVAISDLRVRQAIAYSVDRAVIKRDVFANNVEPLYSLVPPGFAFSAPFYKPVFQTQYGDAKCASANAIWTQLGFSTSFGSRELVARDD